MMQAEIAVLRFGLGARPGDLAAAGGEPRAWLMAQIKGPVPLAVNAPLAPSDQIFTGLLAARDERREITSSARHAAQMRTPAFNAGARSLSTHYRAQVLARAQSAALTTRPFAERLVHFWSNHFAVSADKGVVFGLAGTLENEAIRPHVAGRFVDLLIGGGAAPRDDRVSRQSIFGRQGFRSRALAARRDARAARTGQTQASSSASMKIWRAKFSNCIRWE